MAVGVKAAELNETNSPEAALIRTMPHPSEPLPDSPDPDESSTDSPTDADLGREEPDSRAAEAELSELTEAGHDRNGLEEPDLEEPDLEEPDLEEPVLEEPDLEEPDVSDDNEEAPEAASKPKDKKKKDKKKKKSDKKSGKKKKNKKKSKDKSKGKKSKAESEDPKKARSKKAGSKKSGSKKAAKSSASAMSPELQRITRELETTAAELDKVRTELANLRAREEREDRLVPYQVELLKLQRSLEANNSRMIVLFEGRDAAGKGGTIRRVTRYMNEKHYRTVALGKPTEEQRSQWYLQRYVREFPTGGEIVLFDRSWYNRAMVEPVFGFCSKREYDDFLRGVVGFEKDLVRQDTILVKLYFSVSKKEQQRRFDRRKNDPLRQWKLSEIDMQAQEHWDDFTNHKYEMLRRTHTSQTPWTVIRSESKPDARLNAMKVILNAVDYEGRNPDLDYAPDSDLVLSGAHEVELMEAERLRRGKFRA